MLEFTEHALIRGKERLGLEPEQLKMILNYGDKNGLLRQVMGSHYEFRRGEKCIDFILYKNIVITVLPRHKAATENYTRFTEIYNMALKYGIEIDFPAYRFLEDRILEMADESKFSTFILGLEIEKKPVSLVVYLNSDRARWSGISGIYKGTEEIVCRFWDEAGRYLRWRDLPPEPA